MIIPLRQASKLAKLAAIRQMSDDQRGACRRVPAGVYVCGKCSIDAPNADCHRPGMVRCDRCRADCCRTCHLDEHPIIFCPAAACTSACMLWVCLSAEIEDEWVTCKSPWGGYCDYSVCTHCYNRSPCRSSPPPCRSTPCAARVAPGGRRRCARAPTGSFLINERSKTLQLLRGVFCFHSIYLEVERCSI